MFNKKNDPLVDSVQKVMKENQLRRDAQEAVNKSFGVVSRKALPHERHAAYDKALAETTAKVLKEEISLDEVSRETLTHYISKAKNSDTEKRKKGVELALKKKWADPAYGFGKSAPKVPAGGSWPKKSIKEAIAEAKEKTGLAAIQEEIKSKLVKRMNEAQEQGEAALDAFKSSLTEEQKEILGFNEAWGGQAATNAGHPTAINPGTKVPRPVARAPLTKGIVAGQQAAQQRQQAASTLTAVQAQRSTVRAINPIQPKTGASNQTSGAMNRGANSAAAAAARPATTAAPASAPQTPAPVTNSAPKKSSSGSSSSGRSGSFDSYPDWAKKAFNPDSGA